MTGTPPQESKGCWWKGCLIVVVILAIAIALIFYEIKRELDRMTVQLTRPNSLGSLASSRTTEWNGSMLSAI
jgi:hypothetical protein